MITNLDERQALVAQFHELFQVKRLKTFIDASTSDALTRRVLIDEEFRELASAKDKVETLDAYCDIEYLLAGTLDVLKLPQWNVVVNKGTLFGYFANILTELNKDRLCERGITGAISGARLVLDRDVPHLHEAFLEVHRTNMAKQWNDISTIDPAIHNARQTGPRQWIVTRKSDGKIIKPPDWKPPELEKFVT